MTRQLFKYFTRPQDPAPGLVCLGYGTKIERHDCGPRTWPYFGAVYIRSGSGRFTSAATHGELAVGPGTLLWQFPGVEHLYGPDAHGWREQWIVFDGTVAEGFVDLGVLDPAAPVVANAARSPIPRLFDRIDDTVVEGGPWAAMLGAAHIHHLIVAAHRHVAAGANELDPDPVIAAALDQLERDAFTDVDPATIARAHGLGYSTFRRRFRAATGSSPKAYVLALRIARAKELLAATDDPVATVSLAVGFHDPYYFSRLFREREGRSPSTFRQDHRSH